MKIIDLTESYFENIIDTDNQVEYEASFKPLFDHYFHYWCRRRGKIPKYSKKDIQEKTTKIKSRLMHIKISLFNMLGLDLDNITMILFVGKKRSNGHAFRHNNEAYVWIPVELYSSELCIDVFITHEILHAIHYKNVPDFFFSNKVEKNNVFRQTITEGIATYLTMISMNFDEGTSLWADYVTTNFKNDWLKKCIDNETLLYEYTLQNWNKQNISFFAVDDEKNIYKYRAGYFVGLRVIEQIHKNHNYNFKEIMNLKRDRFEILAIKVIKQMLT